MQILRNSLQGLADSVSKLQNEIKTFKRPATNGKDNAASVAMVVTHSAAGEVPAKQICLSTYDSY
ncbi:hypothetical protein DPMN_190199 [Dreissena polymorpha]|uniref:Uncharacterized protein n=1 Tax=Dreissena polymorpha TaxID=45954 RepID=A0A9D4DUI5_DREPO|nr:hypothetical protein DPMN_190199 [Dreissena polymorpha]